MNGKLVVNDAGGSEKLDVKAGLVEVQHHGAHLQEGSDHHRMRVGIDPGGAASPPIGRLAGTPRGSIDCPLICGETRRLGVSAHPVHFLTIPRRFFHGRGKSCRIAVVPIDQVGTLIGVTMPPHHQIHAARLQQRKEILPHLDQFPVGTIDVVGIVGAESVRRMVPETNNPILHRGFKIALQPNCHRARFGSIRTHGIEANEMHIAVIE